MKLEYYLKKDEYADWIIWYMQRRNKKKMLVMLWGGYAAAAVIFIAATLINSTAADLPMTLFLLALAAAGLVYGTNDTQQFHLLMRRTGVNRMARTNKFPKVTVTFQDTAFLIRVAERNYSERISYDRILSVQKSRLLLLIQTDKNRYQMIARSAFDESCTEEEFCRFIDEKLAEVKRDPEKFRNRGKGLLASIPAEEEPAPGKTPVLKGDGKGRFAALAHMDLRPDDEEMTAETEKEEP